MITKNGIKAGDKVKYNDGDPAIYTVYAVYAKNKVSLSLQDYQDIEQDIKTDIKDITKI